MEKAAKIEIITIGDEILIGQIVDTNSAWMAAEANKAGFEVAQITSIHDDKNQIINTLNSAFERAEILLLTGGIGPTKDDITKQTLCEYFDTRLIFSEQVYQNIVELFQNRPLVMNELTRNQALVPENAKIIQNRVGTAPIMWFEKNGKVAVSMPGVPSEMKEAMSREIFPRLRKQFHYQAIIHKNVSVEGIPESQIALRIADWENALPANIHLAYLPTPTRGVVRLRLSGITENEDALLLEFAINQQIAGLTAILGKAIMADDNSFFHPHQIS